MYINSRHLDGVHLSFDKLAQVDRVCDLKTGLVNMHSAPLVLADADLNLYSSPDEWDVVCLVGCGGTSMPAAPKASSAAVARASAASRASRSIQTARCTTRESLQQWMQLNSARITGVGRSTVLQPADRPSVESGLCPGNVQAGCCIDVRKQVLTYFEPIPTLSLSHIVLRNPQITRSD